MKTVKNSIILYILICLIINFFGVLVNATFSDLKVNIFFITRFICSNKYVKQLVLINHSCISPTLQREWGLELCLFFKKWGRLHFSPKKREVGKIMEER